MTTHNVKMPRAKQNHVEGGIPRVYVYVRMYTHMDDACMRVHERHSAPHVVQIMEVTGVHTPGSLH